jgi:hypothetical protein
MHIAIVAAELNELDIMVGDVSSAYLEAIPKKRCVSLLILNLDHLKEIY